MAIVSMRIGTRKITMALAQTEEIARRLIAVAPELNVEIVTFETRGDQDQTGKLLRHGGKGDAFVAEIRRAVAAGELHEAMHSLKDMPGNEDTPDLVIGATLGRDPPTDDLVRRDGVSIADLRRSKGRDFKIDTNAVRCAACAKRLFPEVEIIHFRGAADTRVRKLDNGEMQRLPGGGEVSPADALIVARSGLMRVELAHRISYDFTVAEMLPAVGHCNSPIAGFSVIEGLDMTLTASVLDEDGGGFIETSLSGPADRPRELGRAVGLDLLNKGAAAIIDRTRPDRVVQ